jgi:hypothetical protein
VPCSIIKQSQACEIKLKLLLQQKPSMYNTVPTTTLTILLKAETKHNSSSLHLTSFQFLNHQNIHKSITITPKSQTKPPFTIYLSWVQICMFVQIVEQQIQKLKFHISGNQPFFFCRVHGENQELCFGQMHSVEFSFLILCLCIV